MYYVEYIQTDGYCWFDTGIVPNINTKIEVDMMPTHSQKENWAGFIGAQNADDDRSTFQIRTYSNYLRWSARVGNGDGANNITTNFVLNTRYLLTLDKDYFTVDGTQYSTNTTSMDTCNYSLYIGAIHNPSWADGRSNYGRFYRVKIWESGVLVGDFKPADNNGSLGFYDEVSQSFKANLGTGTPVAGPVLSSISATPSKTTLKNTGETISIEVSTENAWTLSTSGDSFLTLSSTGDTSGTTITATAPSYSGSTPREVYITFTDTTTSDTAILKIKQKKYTSGQPLYLGADEIAEIYLGADAISEAYLGEDLVFSSAPAPAPTPTNKVLTITQFFEPTNDTENKSVTVQIGGTPIAQYSMEGIEDGEANVIVNVTSDYAATGYTASYSNGTYTIEGPFDANPTVYYSAYDPIQPCYSIDNSETITFTGSSATTTVNFSPGEEPDPECDCIYQGGTWDAENQECVFGGGGCDGDPYCECLENGGTTEECDCMMNGGTWDGSECIYE